MIRLSKKFIRRAITGLALLAPVVYLFGSQFFALAGAHGEEVLAGSEDVVTSVEYGKLNQVVSLNEYVDNTFLDVPFSVIDNVLTIPDGTYDLTAYIPSGSRNYFSIGSNPSYSWITGHTYLFYGDVSGVNSSNSSNMLSLTLSSPYRELFAPNKYIFDITSSGYFFPRLYFFPETYILQDFRAWFNVIDLTLLYGDDIPALSQIEQDYPLIMRPYNLEGERVTRYTYGQNYAGSLYQNFFGSYNFLTGWGQDAISDNPHGFAPFGNMLQFVDENMLHLSDLQIGLMGYGYFYYCAHVLLFVCFFDLTTFFLSWILRITHKFGGADYED